MGAADFEDTDTEQKGNSEKGVSPRDHILHTKEPGFAQTVLMGQLYS